jgi:hypothetical protein
VFAAHHSRTDRECRRYRLGLSRLVQAGRIVGWRVCSSVHELDARRGSWLRLQMSPVRVQVVLGRLRVVGEVQKLAAWPPRVAGAG